MLEAFATPRIDVSRTRRLVLGACLGAAALHGVGQILMRARPASLPEAEPEPEPVAVALVETPEELPPEPTPALTPAATPAAPGPRRPPPAAMPMAVPDQVKLADANDAYDLGSGAGNAEGPPGGGSGGPAIAAVAPPPPPPPPPPAAPPPKKTALSPEDYEPPQCKLGQPNRAAAKSLGVEGTVVVKYTVTESGAIANAIVVKGPPELHGLVLSAIATSTCAPARLKADGSAISVTRTVRYPIRFSTQ